MKNAALISGFSKLSQQEKTRLVTELLANPAAARETLSSFFHPDTEIQSRLSEFSENTLSNFALPYSIAPNFLIDGRMYMVPMVIEESSVVAAASAAARFWAERGGFHTRIPGTEKSGQFHFLYRGDHARIDAAKDDIAHWLRQHAHHLEENMKKRGGGIVSIRIVKKPDIAPDYFQVDAAFETADAMGANFINSCLEVFSTALGEYFESHPGFDVAAYEPLMAILSNFTPACVAEAWVECPVDSLGNINGFEAGEFARRFVLATTIAQKDVYRAVTHNKGIMNGADAVVVATGNDFRAIEAGVHAYASHGGSYRSLSEASIHDGIFRFGLRMPIAIGTLGGLTRLHPLAALSLEILGKPGAPELMSVVASAGLANNFAAVKSLVTTGIQAGHMRMHLPNILRQLNATEAEKQMALKFFEGRKLSYRDVESYLNDLRKGK